MKKLFIAAVMFAIAALLSGVVYAQTWSNTLYNQEGTGSDGYAPINASGQGPNGDPNNNYTNWKYQYGSASWSGVYSWDSDAWLTVAESGDESLQVECDIEMYCSTTIADHKIYFHLGDPYNATAGDKTAQFTGTMTANNGMYIGISFEGSSKTEADFDLGTGMITDAMVGTVDCGGRDISTEAFDVKLLMTWGAGYRVPDAYGDGAHSSIHDTLWWEVDSGNPGSYNLTWEITLYPDTYQPDGNYKLDPEIVVAPTL